MLEHGFTGLTVHAASTPARTPSHVGSSTAGRDGTTTASGVAAGVWGSGGGPDVSTLNDIAGDKQTLSPPLNCGQQTHCPS